MTRTCTVSGIRWQTLTKTAAFVALIAGALPAGSSAAQRPTASIIVTERPGAGDAPERAVHRIGGSVVRQLGIIDGFVAQVPAGGAAILRGRSDVRQVTANRRFTVRSTPPQTVQAGTSLADVRAAVGADAVAHDGSGIDVALIDTGVAPVDALRGRVVDGPDFSADAEVEGMAHLDGLGHGTHLAGIIVGSDPAEGFTGVAPGARLINVRAADHAGETTLGRLLAAIDWVATARERKGGLDPKVLVLAFGAEVSGTYVTDPLAHAVEAAWRRGVTVVVSGGNGGWDSGKLDSPAYDPYVIAAGASDDAGTPTLSDDRVAEFSSAGDGKRNPDVIAPGTAIVSLRVPGSMFDEAFPQARIGERFFRGSGTSQSAAVVGAAAALLLDARPGAGPDEVKALLTATAQGLPDASELLQGHGVIDVLASSTAAVPSDARQRWTHARPGGSWRGAGQAGVEQAVENPDAWPANRWGANRWGANRWGANRWGANRWGANRWGANRWGANRWGANRWGANRWGADGWSSVGREDASDG